MRWFGGHRTARSTARDKVGGAVSLTVTPATAVSLAPSGSLTRRAMTCGPRGSVTVSIRPVPSGFRLPPRSSNHSYIKGSTAPAGVSGSVEPDPSSRIAAPAGPVHSTDAGTAMLARGGRF